MALVGPVVDAQSFNWFKGCGTQEISQFKGNEHIFFGRLYDDACDQGFRLINKNTLKVEAFYLACTLNDDEGDVQCWVFRPVNPTLNEAGVRINLFND